MRGGLIICLLGKPFHPGNWSEYGIMRTTVNQYTGHQSLKTISYGTEWNNHVFLMFLMEWNVLVEDRVSNQVGWSLRKIHTIKYI